MPRIRVRHNADRFWLLFDDKETVQGFADEIVKQLGETPTHGRLDIFVQEFKVPLHLSCAIFAPDDILDVEWVPFDGQVVDTSRPAMPSLKRRKLSERTNQLLDVPVVDSMPTYQTALPMVQPAILSNSRPNLADFFSTALQQDQDEDSEQDGDFEMGSDGDSDDDVMSDSSAEHIPRTALPDLSAVAIENQVMLPEDVQVSQNRPPVDSAPSPVYQPASPKIRVPTPPLLSVLEDLTSSSASISDGESPPLLTHLTDLFTNKAPPETELIPEHSHLDEDPIGQLMKESLMGFKLDMSRPVQEEGGANSSSDSDSSDSDFVETEVLATKIKQVNGMDDQESSDSSSDSSSSSSSDSSSSDSSSSSSSSAESTSFLGVAEPPIQSSAHKYAEIVDHIPSSNSETSSEESPESNDQTTHIQMPMLYHPDIVKPEYWWVSKLVGYPVSEFPQLQGREQPASIALNDVPEAEKVKNWLQENRQAEVLHYLNKLKQNASAQRHIHPAQNAPVDQRPQPSTSQTVHVKKATTQPNKKESGGLPHQGMTRTQLRNARRKAQRKAEQLRLKEWESEGRAKQQQTGSVARGMDDLQRDMARIAELKHGDPNSGDLAQEKAQAIAMLDSIQENVMNAIESREAQLADSMRSLTNKNKKKGFKKQMQDAKSHKTFFPDLAASIALKTGESAYPSAQTDIPHNIKITAVDVEAPNFVPGEAQPDFQRLVPQSASKLNGNDNVAYVNGDWSDWDTIEQVSRRFPLLPAVRDASLLKKGDRIAYQVIEMSSNFAPEYATYYGLITEHPSFSVTPATNLLTTSTTQGTPEKEECYLSIKLHPSSIRPSYDDEGNEFDGEEDIVIGFDELADIRNLVFNRS